MSSHTYSPYYLLFGREITLALDTALAVSQSLPSSTQGHLSKILQSHETALQVAKENIANAQAKYKKQYDKSCHEPNFHLGQKVWLYCSKVQPGASKKMTRAWTGPFYIVGQYPNYCFKLRKASDNKLVKSLIHANRLKVYHDPATRPTTHPSSLQQLSPDILFNSLRDWFGVDGTVLRWIRSYLSNRKQKVKLGNSFSDVFSLPYGVPQGSVLGPLLFTLYTTPLSNIISNFNVTHHLYADDTQIYLALDNRNFDSSFAELTECLTCIQNWMAGVKLKLNPEKTEFIIIGDRQARESLINKFPTQLLGNSISPTDTVKNLGVIFDSGNTFSNHITNMCRACYYHLKDLRRIRKFLSVETAALLANSMISSRLDYCNSLLYGISKYNVAKLQKIQNALCRIVFRLDRTSHVTLFLQKLHWLPITYRILFKYNLITFKAINFSQPIYLSSLIKTSCLTRGNRLSLSSASHKKAIGRRGFVVASPIEWNRLPQSVRSQQTITGFRSQLKTYLFRLAYPPP